MYVKWRNNRFFNCISFEWNSYCSEYKEKELIIWLAEHDQTVMGIGNAGFDISEIPWNFEDYENEKKFILKVIDGAIKKTGWGVLDYAPNEEFILGYLKTFHNLINDFEREYIDKNAYKEWVEYNDNIVYHLPQGYPDCSEREKKLGFDAISDHKDLVLKYKEYMDDNDYNKWASEQRFPKIKMPDGFLECKKHHAILYWHGCIICNDVINKT